MPGRHKTKYKKKKKKEGNQRENPSVKICDFLKHFVTAISVFLVLLSM